MAGQLHYAKQAQGSKSAHDAAVVFGLNLETQAEVNEAHNDYSAVKQVESVVSVILDSESNQLYDHFDSENPDKDDV